MLLAAVVGGVLVAGAAFALDRHDGASPQPVAATCPVTIPQDVAPGGSRGAGWHGAGGVRVTLPLDGKLVVTSKRPPPAGMAPGTVSDDGSISAKFLWWLSSSAGDRVSVTARMLGGSRKHTLVEGRRRLEHFWPSRLRFPRGGCWRVTGATEHARLKFVIDVSVDRS